VLAVQTIGLDCEAVEGPVSAPSQARLRSQTIDLDSEAVEGAEWDWEMERQAGFVHVQPGVSVKSGEFPAPDLSSANSP